MLKRLILVVHAETAATRRGTFPMNEGIEPRGREAAQKLAGAMPKAETALTASARAARETAAALGLEATVERALADIDIGTWAGRSVMDIGATDSEGAAAWIADPAFAGHGGESFETLIRRVDQWLAARTSANGATICVTHAAILRAAVIAVTGADAAAFWRIEAGPLAQLMLSSNGSRWTLRELCQR